MAAKPIKPVNSWGFRGMSNLPREPALFYDQERKVTPQILLNAMVTDGGVIKERAGITKQGEVPGLHSLWAGSIMLGVGVDDNVLYLIKGSYVTSLTTIPGPIARVRYAEINGLVFMSNPYWKGIYDINAGSLRDWGIDVPNHPIVSICSGNLPPGTYTLCYTLTVDGRMSGNGQLVQVSWEGVTQGIRLSNLPAGGQCWITNPNGKKLMLASVESGVVTGHVPQGEPLLSFMCAPPPFFEDFCLAFGRIWGVRGKKLYYSFPGFLEWFRSSDFKGFQDFLVMVAPVNEGLFVSSLTDTWHLSGTDPSKMTVSRMGDGAIPGTLTFAQMPASLAGGAATSASFASQSVMPSPVWMTRTGFVVGTHSGHITQLTDHQVQLTGRKHGAAVYHVDQGIPRIIASLYGQPVDSIETVLDEIFIRGSLF